MKKNSKKKIAIKEDWYYLIPLAFIIGIVPLIVRFIYIPLDGIAKQYWTGPYDSDIYTYWKVVWMEIAAFALFILGFIKLSKKEFEIKKTKYYIPISIYAFFIILSSSMSQYKDLVVNGYPNRHESVFVLLIYVLIMISAIIFVNCEKHVKILLGTLIGSAAIVGTIGILQFLGYDFMKSKEFVKAFIIPGFYYKMGEVNVSFDNIGISSTLYNSDFVGSYIALILPISICLLAYLKKTYQKILMVLFSCLMFANLLGSRSRAGVVGAIFSALIMLVILRKYIIKKWMYSLGVVIASILVILLLNNITGKEKLANQLALIKNDVQQLFIVKKDTNWIEDIKIDKNEATILTKNNPIVFAIEKDQIIFKGNNTVLVQKKEESKEGTKITFNENNYRDYIFTLKPDKSTIEAKVLGHTMKFKLTTDGIMFIDGVGQLVKLEPVKKIEVGEKGHLGSSRVYIWSRTIPLLKDSLFIGMGPGTFPINFPQRDYVGKLLNGAPAVLIDKPHNWYLETAANTGVISLLALLIFMGMYFISSIKLYFKNDFNNFYEITGIGVFAGISGYAAAALFNDSVVPVAPVFWILLGLGISINYLIKEQRIKELVDKIEVPLNNIKASKVIKSKRITQ